LLAAKPFYAEAAAALLANLRSGLSTSMVKTATFSQKGPSETQNYSGGFCLRKLYARSAGNDADCDGSALPQEDIVLRFAVLEIDDVNK